MNKPRLKFHLNDVKGSNKSLCGSFNRFNADTLDQFNNLDPIRQCPQCKKMIEARIANG